MDSSAQKRLTAHVGAQHFGHGDRAVGVLAVLQHRHQGAAHGQARAVQGVHQLVLALGVLEAGLQAARLEGYRGAGVNRVSLGLQSLDDAALAFLGRAHSVAESLGALTVAQQHFDRVNIDLIYARPEQTAEQWAAELRRALSFGTDHMSLYQLTIEAGTRFETLVRTGHFTPADDDDAALHGVNVRCSRRRPPATARS